MAQQITIDRRDTLVSCEVEHRMPSGWWILPSALLGPLMWYVIIRAILSLF